jgi:hypothetical protein
MQNEAACSDDGGLLRMCCMATANLPDQNTRWMATDHMVLHAGHSAIGMRHCSSCLIMPDGEAVKQ